jgi:hypothetical protein
MTVQTFRNLLQERPFKSFRLVMSSGQAYEVRHPEMALLTKTTDNRPLTIYSSLRNQ